MSSNASKQEGPRANVPIGSIVWAIIAIPLIPVTWLWQKISGGR